MTRVTPSVPLIASTSTRGWPTESSSLSDRGVSAPASVEVLSDDLDALCAHATAWGTLSENGPFEATLATVRMDLAVTASLASCVPADLCVVDPLAGLPTLPFIGVDLRFPACEASLQ